MSIPQCAHCGTACPDARHYSMNIFGRLQVRVLCEQHASANRWPYTQPVLLTEEEATILEVMLQ